MNQFDLKNRTALITGGAGFIGSHFQPSFPDGNISFMYEIPGMRAFKPLDHQGPSSQPTNIRIKKGDDGITMKLWFDFRKNQE